MGRVDVFELEDFGWFPSPLREYATDYLAFMASLTPKIFHPFAEKLASLMEETGDKEILDLCSGASGPIQPILQHLEKLGKAPTRVTLTDLYPNLTQFERVQKRSGNRIQYVKEPVDATQVPAHLGGFRLICNGFHHFSPENARKILGDAVRHNRGIGVLELIERSPFAFASVATVPLTVLLGSPFIQPFRLGRLVWTYVVPVVPLMALWDGIASCFRAYSLNELRELTQGLGGPGYRWEIERTGIPGTPAHMHTLFGIPARPS